MVQQLYHEGVTNSAQWNASFCYPEGLVRWWVEVSRGGNMQMVVTPWMVQTVSGIADNFLRQVLVDKPSHVLTNPQFYGETIGFWDGTTLVTHTANVQGWVLHSLFEYSNKMEIVETWKPRMENGQFAGLDHEAISTTRKLSLLPCARPRSSSGPRRRRPRVRVTCRSPVSATSRTRTAARASCPY